MKTDRRTVYRHSSSRVDTLAGKPSRRLTQTPGTQAVSTIVTTTPPTESPWPLYRMPIEQYEAMVESGVFTERDRLQLVNGMLVAKVTQGDAYCTADDLCREVLATITPAGWYVRPNKPVRLPPSSEPEPDHAVVCGTIRDYRHRHPGPDDIALIVEIAASSKAPRRGVDSSRGSPLLAVAY
jgi:Uma2 family endonuclease